MSDWQTRELKIQHDQNMLRGLAQGTLDNTRRIMEAASGDDFDRNWRCYLAAMIEAAKAELADGG